jgi:colicin import membrane protein
MSDIMLPEELKNEIVSIEEMTKSIVVRNSEERALVADAIRTVKQKKNRIVEFFKDFKDKAFQAHRSIVAAEKAETDKLEAFEAAGKLALLIYDKAEEEKRELERRRLQAIADEAARKEREKAEAEARRQRQIEEEARRKADEARRAAEAASVEERARLLKEAIAAERKAAIASEKAETQTENAAQVVAPVVQIAPNIEKSKGESVSDKWAFEVTDLSQVPREYLILNVKAIAGIARATKGSINIAGIRFYSEKTLSMRRC